MDVALEQGLISTDRALDTFAGVVLSLRDTTVGGPRPGAARSL